MKTKLHKNYTKESFLKEYEKVKYSDTSNAYNLVSVGSGCGKERDLKYQTLVKRDSKR